MRQVIVATRKAYITGVSPERAHELFLQNGPPNPIYRHNAECVTSAVILWPGMIASFARSVSSPLLNYQANSNSSIAPTSCGNPTLTTMNSGPKQQHTETKAKKHPLIYPTRIRSRKQTATLLRRQHALLNQPTNLILELNDNSVWRWR